MNEIIAKDVKLFLKGFISSSSSVKISQTRLDERLATYRTDKNKHEFLMMLRREVVHNGLTHNCGTPNCRHGDLINNATFTIDQELELLERYFSPDQNPSEEFTAHEKVDTNAKIDEALERLQNLGFGQQIIFEELEELKQHLNLDKKNWTQLVKGKLLDLVTEKVLDKVVVVGLYETLTQSIHSGHFELPQ